MARASKRARARSLSGMAALLHRRRVPMNPQAARLTAGAAGPAMQAKPLSSPDGGFRRLADCLVDVVAVQRCQLVVDDAGDEGSRGVHQNISMSASNSASAAWGSSSRTATSR